MNLFHDNDVQINRMVNFFNTLNLTPLITLPTRVPTNADAGSLIDNIWTNITQYVESIVFDCNITDHFPIASIFPFLMGNNLVKLKFRNFSQANTDAFVGDFEYLRESFVDSIDLHATHINLGHWLADILNQYFPLCEKFVGLKRLNTPWLSKRMLVCINKKHKMYRLFKYGLISRAHFNVYKNKLKTAIKCAKRSYFNQRFLLAKHNIKKTWDIINKTLNRKKTGTLVDSLKVNNNLEFTDRREICDALNSYFVTAAHNLHSDLAGADDDIDGDFLHFIPYNSDSIVILDSDPMEVFAVIRDLNNSTNIEMPTRFIKLFAEVLSPVLSRLFNECLDSGIFPNSFKIANVTPLFKSGERSDPGNYRPISVLSDLNKVYETLLLTRLISLIDAKSILSPSQYGFRNNRSTQEACIDLLDVLYKAFTNKTYAISLFVDFRKAFDCVDHDRLLLKLYRYGIRGRAHALVKSYLNDRTQCVRLQGHKSEVLSVNCGIPQGSKLGPLLFNLFVNDISNVFLGGCSSPFQFADDTAFAACGEDLNTLLDAFNTDMALFYKWCFKNKLFINYDKTKAMLFTSRPLNNDIPNVIINGIQIEYVNDYDYLGVTIDSGLTFRKHTTKLNIRLRRLVGVTFYLNCALSLHAAKIFYSSMVSSLIRYAIVIWGGTFQCYISDLQISKNKIICNLFLDKMPEMSTNEIYYSLSILKVTSIYKLELGKLIYTSFYMEKYPKLRMAIQNLGWSHNFNTRKINALRLPRAH